ncbi:FMN-dependent NADH-azoreductase [Paraburkholderia caffeinilytica]|uniref:FMN dependent NADH:quinone oxidoreductase n=1 Tax=Paraburkholderia caffeinilytica TaxID=1761016 RepID=A0ABQ1LN45_9BURK|nr:NAD(P)H-dependent oxidoreductase [Paraburkholderia caffeinilytica]AXL53688.1 FMN-dependent NADH-azoreductase [Paraburkholderia caffeinilytica]GGC26952.1 FMN-dependent NADH-azoreductase [Paraburkholderia caffeinilytica]CAB3779935.1 FMN-dependent NADH-azoreductase 1 [Paraburkholderia caffeinilytica]
MQLLHIDSSISGTQSISRQISANIVSQLKLANPLVEVNYRDLAAVPVPQHSTALQNLKLDALSQSGALNADSAQFDVSDARGDHAARLTLQHDFAAIQSVLDEFLAAEIVVIGAPMYNFGIPSQLKSWIDCLAVPGKTFRYTETAVEGLCGGKQIIVASSRGGFYSGQSPMAVLDHQESYLTGFFRFIGVTNIEFIRAEGVNYGAESRQRAIDAALAEAATVKAG